MVNIPNLFVIARNYLGCLRRFLLPHLKLAASLSQLTGGVLFYSPLRPGNLSSLIVL